MKEANVTSLTLSVTSKTENVTHVVRELEKFCINLNFDKKLIETLIIATDEAITNIVLHAYGGHSDGKIEVTFKLNNKEFIIEFKDFGKSFKPINLNIDSKLSDKLKIGGYGLVLMNALMDELNFSHDKNDKANLLVMKKFLN